MAIDSKIDGFPTIRHYNNGVKVKDFSGMRDERSISNFLAKVLEENLNKSAVSIGKIRRRRRTKRRSKKRQQKKSVKKNNKRKKSVGMILVMRLSLFFQVSDQKGSRVRVLSLGSIWIIKPAVDTVCNAVFLQFENKIGNRSSFLDTTCQKSSTFAHVFHT